MGARPDVRQGHSVGATETGGVASASPATGLDVPEAEAAQGSSRTRVGDLTAWEAERRRRIAEEFGGDEDAYFDAKLAAVDRLLDKLGFGDLAHPDRGGNSKRPS